MVIEPTFSYSIISLTQGRLLDDAGPCPRCSKGAPTSRPVKIVTPANKKLVKILSPAVKNGQNMAPAVKYGQNFASGKMYCIVLVD
jgi:hypothetical protein